MDGAALWKVIGLALTTTLGVIGTVTDTKEKTDTGYKVRPIGWLVAAGILTSSLVGGIAQHLDDAAANAKQSAQLDTLNHIVEVSDRNLNRFSGQLRIEGSGLLSLEESPLREKLMRYKIYYAKFEAVLQAKGLSAAARMKPSEQDARASVLSELRKIKLVISLPLGHGLPGDLYAEALGEDIHWNFGDEDIGSAKSITVLLSGVVEHERSDGIRSVADFSARPLKVFTNVERPLFNMDGDSFTSSMRCCIHQ